jgi:hypothetical protein
MVMKMKMKMKIRMTVSVVEAIKSAKSTKTKLG